MVTARRVVHALDVARWRLSRLLRLPPLELLGWGAIAWGVIAIAAGVGFALDVVAVIGPKNPNAPQVAVINLWIQVAIMVVAAIISYALTPKPKDPTAAEFKAPVVEDGKGIVRIYGTVWIDDSIILGWKQMGTQSIRKKMGSGWFAKKQLIGHWYKLLLHFGWCQGPIDAFLEFRGGDRAAWKGELTQSGQIQIAGGNIWGGDEKEGGIEGAFDVMLGEQTQQPNDYLAANLGPEQTAYRGKATGVFRGGRYGAGSPYPKPASFKLRRILKGWDNDMPWYPETATIRGAPTSLLQATSLYIALDTSGSMAGTRLDTLKAAMSIVFDSLEAHVAGTAVPLSIKVVGWATTAIQITKPNVSTADFPALRSFVDGLTAGGSTYATAAYGGAVGFFNPSAPNNNVAVCVSDGDMSEIAGGLALVGDMLDKTTDPYSTSAGTAVSLYGVGIGTVGSLATFDNSGGPVPVIDGTSAAQLADLIMDALYRREQTGYMNPAHILYDSLTARSMQGEPIADIDGPAFRAAAEKLYGESFGLCTSYDPASETIEAFQQRICNVIGGSLSKSRIDGRWRLLLVRGDYDPGAMPVLTDDDILEWSEDPSTLDDAVNQVAVEWFDPQQKEKRITAPLQSMGAIQAFGGVISETAKYPEIPEERLALRVGGRDLRSKATPLRRLSLVSNRKASGWSAGGMFRLQAPRRGIADMVCIIGGIDAGTTRSSAVRLEVIQSVFSLPDVTYVDPEPGIDTTPSEVPQPSRHQRAFEVPYVELAGNLSRADLAALPPDASYLAMVAAKPPSGLSYTLATSPDGASYEEVATADWCPTAVVAGAVDRQVTQFAFTEAKDLDRVELGTAALWDEEIVRVDAVDEVSGIITVGRGCADTVPVPHDAGSRVYFYDAWSAVDTSEYVDGETVHAKALTNTNTQKLSISIAPALSVLMSSRQWRPYPPASVRVNGAESPLSADGALEVSWAHRDRLLQADQLVDQSAASIGPEPGTSYTVSTYLDGVLSRSESGIAGSTATVSSPSSGMMRVEVIAVRGGIESRQAQSVTFIYTTAPATPGSLLTSSRDELLEPQSITLSGDQSGALMLSGDQAP